MSLYKRWHMIGLELGMSAASVGIRKEPTGAASCFSGRHCDRQASFKFRGITDGEGGYTVYGKLAPSNVSPANGNLPLGLAHDLKLTRDVAKDHTNVGRCRNRYHTQRL